MIDKLEYFIALAREQHFGRAAEECGVTQPTLSAGIKQLEDTLGVMLVQRGSRFQGLTPEGSRVLEWARRIVGDARTMREEMRAARQGLAGHVRIAAIPTALAMTPQADDAVPRQASGRHLLDPVAQLDRGADAARQFRDRHRHHLSGERAAGTGGERAALLRALPADHRRREPLFRPRHGDLGGGRAAAALPAHARHAEPPHHQPPSRRRRRARPSRRWNRIR